LAGLFVEDLGKSPSALMGVLYFGGGLPEVRANTIILPYGITWGHHCPSSLSRYQLGFMDCSQGTTCYGAALSGPFELHKSGLVLSGPENQAIRLRA
jgi:hypothetical protein